MLKTPGNIRPLGAVGGAVLVALAALPGCKNGVFNWSAFFPGKPESKIDTKQIVDPLANSAAYRDSVAEYAYFDGLRRLRVRGYGIVVGRPRAEVRFEAPTPGARPRLAERFGGVKFRFFEPVDPVTPARTELGEYVGTYVSDEAEATYHVALQDDKLVLKRPRREAASLQPLLRDVFITGYTIRFTRHSSNRVSAMLFNWYGVRNFRFTKQRP